ncbi:MAG: Trm112 family protein [Acidobacteriia bacterium]|nr:Trm112 family protein [Terriglobia bacterium]
MISKELLDILACPVCKAPLSLGTDTLKCSACRRVYPIRDGIPILLEEEGRIENQ